MRNVLIVATMMLGLLLSAGLPTFAGDSGQHSYFGRGPGYLDPDSDFMSYGDPGARYFRSTYPEDQWDKYGYGTGHLGQGYGPYIFGGRNRSKMAEDRPDFGLRVLKPRFKWVSGHEVRVTAPSSPTPVRMLRVDIVNFVGAVLETGTVSTPPYEIVARLPEGAAQIRVRTEMDDGWNAGSFSIENVR